MEREEKRLCVIRHVQHAMFTDEIAAVSTSGRSAATSCEFISGRSQGGTLILEVS
jgi:hypothetical protein